MAHMSLFWCQKQGSTTTTTTSGSSRGGEATPTTTATAADRHCRSCGIGRLMRMLRKQSRLLCMASRPTAFHCQYDPLSYSRNFDRGSGTALDDDSAHFYYTFSSRFVANSSGISRGLTTNH
ncbi:uncharacterized protein LOC120106262 [Phoenix dactylifera]|uniref:Uncharacterized protein LOC120106262 n=1 Tax=Phoenix dactylifera TaxID=42345 RepID=A0A8B8ZLS8_PHODC|nr:uncharacterized protein LOC120106262 [Phoenix dactylifera]